MSDDDDRKPQSDEAHSAFAPVEGFDAAAPAETDEQPTSEFTIPDGLRIPPAPEEPESSAFTPPPAFEARLASHFTPPEGVPLVKLIKEAPWQDQMRTMLRTPSGERPAPEPTQRHEDEAGPAVPRVLDLTLRIGELLLAGGEGAEDVEAALFAVTRSYGLDRCEPNVTFTELSISYQPSLVDHPVTAARTVRRRGTDYTRLAAVYRLVDDIGSTDVEVSLEEAYRRLAEIRRNRHPYPGWALTAAAGLLAGAASTLVGGGVVVFVAAAVGAMLGDRFAWLVAGRGMPEFYQFVVAAMAPAGMGCLTSVLDLPAGRSAAVITGGLFALIPGRALVAGVQDGLTGYYLTAAARLLEVAYLIVGIVCGVLIALSLGLALGAGLTPETEIHSPSRPLIQIAAAMALSLAFAILLQQERSTVLMVTLNGGVAWVVFGAMATAGRMSPVLATAVAAGLVGLFGQLLSRYRFASALPYVTAAIGPLLPGSAFYFGLLEMSRNNLPDGLASLSKAVTLALAIAIGVNLGAELARLFLRRPGATSPAARRAAKRTRGF
ncbi:threonine/serine exporter family protein [Streptomyces sp. O3]